MTAPFARGTLTRPSASIDPRLARLAGEYERCEGPDYGASDLLSVLGHRARTSGRGE